MRLVEDVVTGHPGVVLEAGRDRLPGQVEVLFPVGRQPEIGVGREGGGRKSWAPGLVHGIPVGDADGRPGGCARVAKARAPAETEVHIEDDIEPVPVERRDRDGDTVEIGLVDAAALWLVLRRSASPT